ncbi:MAG: 30S ribosomal protein S20 [Caldilineaceae bacterium]
MANTKSAEKAARQSAKRQAQNRIMLGGSRTAVKKTRTAIAGGNTTEAQEALREAMSVLDRAATKGVIHKNNASRRKSRLALALNKLQAAK